MAFKVLRWSTNNLRAVARVLVSAPLRRGVTQMITKANLALPGNRELYTAYVQLRSTLEMARASNPLKHSAGYYPYGTIDIVPQILPLVEKYGLDLKTLVARKTILDLGCGDGDLSFFLERCQGERLIGIDFGPTNYNGMEACHVLKHALGSRVQFLDSDVHSLKFEELPVFDTTFCFGFLYHSRHPLWVLENLARVTRHLFITSKVFDHEKAYAYFYDIAECNKDATNWWCFTPNALSRMLKRAGFNLNFIERLDRNVGRSDPVDLALDGRVFAYATRGEG